MLSRRLESIFALLCVYSCLSSVAVNSILYAGLPSIAVTDDSRGSKLDSFLSSSQSAPM